MRDFIGNFIEAVHIRKNAFSFDFTLLEWVISSYFPCTCVFTNADVNIALY